MSRIITTFFIEQEVSKSCGRGDQAISPYPNTLPHRGEGVSSKKSSRRWVRRGSCLPLSLIKGEGMG